MCLRAVDFDSASSLQQVQMRCHRTLLCSAKIKRHTNAIGPVVLLSGYDPYAGYYNQDGTTTYAYDPNTYTAPAPSANPAEAALTAPTTTTGSAEASAAAPTVAVPLPAALATTSADATATSDAPAKPVPLSADQTAAAAQEIGAEHAANCCLLTRSKIWSSSRKQLRPPGRRPRSATKRQRSSEEMPRCHAYKVLISIST